MWCLWRCISWSETWPGDGETSNPHFIPLVRDDGWSHSAKHLSIHMSNEHPFGTTRPFAGRKSSPRLIGQTIWLRFKATIYELRVTIATFAAFILLVAILWLGALWANGLGLDKIIAQNKSQPSIDLPTAIDVAVTHHGPELWFLAALAIVVGIARRSRVAFLTLAWFIAVGAIALIPPVIGKLGPPSLVVLMAFLPAALVVGDAAQLAYERLAASHQIVRAAVWIATLVNISLIGARIWFRSRIRRRFCSRARMTTQYDGSTRMFLHSQNSWSTRSTGTELHSPHPTVAAGFPISLTTLPNTLTRRR